jgi:hypothetical protein
MKLIDIFGGISIKIPSRFQIEEVTRDIDIYSKIKAVENEPWEK